MRGNITKRGKNSWRLKFDIGRDSVTGKRRTHFSTFRGTKREAQIELARLITEAESGNYVAPDKLTVSEFLQGWERDWVSLNVSPKTAERYSDLMRLHVRPHIGNHSLQKLRPLDLSSLYAKLLKEGRGNRGLSARTVGHVHRVLHRALGFAVRWNVINQNPAGTVAPPPVEQTEVEILSAEQVCVVLDSFEGFTLYPIISLALATGMRRGEILALRWKDLNLEAIKLRVEQSLEQTKEGIRAKAPKTRHGRRSISLPASTVDMLRGYRREQLEQRMALGLGKVEPNALVFPNLDGSPRNPHLVSTEFVRTLKRLKLPSVTFHGLRHTHASALIAAGVDVLTISRRLGHGSPTVTLNVYGHLFSNTDDIAAQAIEGAFGAKRTS
jgi:integrase